MMQMPRKDMRSQSLDLLRFPLALFVTAVHVFVIPPYLNMTDSSFAEAYPASEYLLRFIDAFITDQSVPIYYFIAGFVFFLGLEFTFTGYTGKLKRRCRSLLIPYLVWNTIAILYLLKMYLPVIGGMSLTVLPETDLSLSAFINCFWDESNGIAPHENMSTNGIYPIDKPLWFVRDLMIMVLIAPAIHAIYELPGKVAVALLSSVTFIYMLRLPDLGHLSLLLEAFPFFAWGGFLSYHKKDMMLEFGRFRHLSFVLYPLLALIIIIFKPYAPQLMIYVKSVNVIVGLFFYYNIAASIITRWKVHSYKSGSFFATASFFIYCGHYIIIDPIGRRLFAMIDPASDAAMLTYMVILFLSVIGVLLVSFSLMRRFTPRLLKLLTGGRL